VSVGVIVFERCCSSMDDAERDLEYAVEHATGEGRMFHSWAYYLALRKVDDLKRWQVDALGVSEVIDAVPGTEGEEKELQPLAPRQAVGPQCPRNDLTFGSIRSGVQKGSQTNSTSTPVTPSSIRVT